MMMAKDNIGRALLAAAVNSGRKCVLKDLLTDTEERVNEEVCHRSILFNLWLEPCSVDCGLPWFFADIICIRYHKYARS